MKKLLLISLMTFLFSRTTFGQTTISVDSVLQYVGKQVTVCSKVYGTKAFDKVTLINLGAKYPNHPLTVAVFKKDYEAFEKPVEELYNAKKVCVTGTIQMYKNKAEIVISKPEQMVILKEEPDESR